MVAAPLLDSSSGWACTHISRRRAGAAAEWTSESVAEAALIAAVAASAMKPLFPMTERDDGARRRAARADGGTPTIPRARGTSGPAGPATTGTPASPVQAARPWWRRGWDIPWLGGRSTAPWVVLVTVLILLLALGGALYAKQKPDRLGFTPRTTVATSDGSVQFTFDVYKAPEAEAACDIVAADRDGGVGSLRDIRVPARADGQETTVVTVTVPTTRRADTAVLEG